MTIFSICIPTYNRDKYLKISLEHLTSDPTFLNTDDVEIVVSDNHSDDGTEELCRGYAEKFPNKFIYIRQKKNIKDENFPTVLNLARGKYAKLNNDNFYFKEGELKNIVEILRNENEASVIFFTSFAIPPGGYTLLSCHGIEEMFGEITYYITWIGGLCVKTEDYKKLEHPDRFAKWNFPQADIMARLLGANNRGLIYQGAIFESTKIENKGGYNIAKVFGRNYCLVLKKLEKEKYISHATYEREIANVLLRHTNFYYFDHKKQFAFKNWGYLWFLGRFYGTKPYFYIAYYVNIRMKLEEKFPKLFKKDKK